LAKPRIKESLGTNLLVSFLVRYPQLSTLRYDPQSRTLSFTLFLKGDVDPVKMAAFLAHVDEHWEVARMIDPAFSPLGRIEHATHEGITALLYEQSVEVLNLEEVRLFVQLACDVYRGDLSDDEWMTPEAELVSHEETLSRLLGQKAELAEEKILVAYREGGRVFVYNK